MADVKPLNDGDSSPGAFTRPAPVSAPPAHPLARRMLSEAVGTALLVTVVVGSGIAAQMLSPNDVGLQLLENSIATAFGLAVLILQFGPVSGARRCATSPPTPQPRLSELSPEPCWPTPCTT